MNKRTRVVLILKKPIINLTLLHINFLLAAPMPPSGRPGLRGIYHINPTQAQRNAKSRPPVHTIFYIPASPDVQEHHALGLWEFTFRTGVSERERERFAILASGRIRPAFILTLGFPHMEYASVS
jgi:hypothetical protein